MKCIAGLLIWSLAIASVRTAQADSFGSNANSFVLEFVSIGHPGNPDDTVMDIGDPSAYAGIGSIDYTFNISKYEISRDIVTKANTEGNLGITLADMTSYGGNGANRPATGVSWNEAARFVNWLNTSRGFNPVYKFSAQPGDIAYSADADIQLWQPGDVGYNAANLFRNSLAHYFLPSIEEWYKAAHFDPNANGGAGGYWNYASGSDTPPVPVSEGGVSGTAVYLQTASQGPADVDKAGGLSPFGVMGLGGNVSEIQETEPDLVNDFVPMFGSLRGVRGGNWNSNSADLFGPVAWGVPPRDSVLYLGFRVASVPEPTSFVLCGVVAVGLLRLRRRMLDRISAC